MNTKPTQEEITDEIAKLKEMKPRVRKMSYFGYVNRAAVDAQIRVLERRMTSDEADNKYEYAADNVRDSAQEAAQWIGGESVDGKPSEGWENLCS